MQLIHRVPNQGERNTILDQMTLIWMNLLEILNSLYVLEQLESLLLIRFTDI